MAWYSLVTLTGAGGGFCLPIFLFLLFSGALFREERLWRSRQRLLKLR